jgi:hypothetical protein
VQLASPVIIDCVAPLPAHAFGAAHVASPATITFIHAYSAVQVASPAILESLHANLAVQVASLETIAFLHPDSSVQTVTLVIPRTPTSTQSIGLKSQISMSFCTRT